VFFFQSFQIVSTFKTMLRINLYCLVALATVIFAAKYPILDVAERIDENGVKWVGPIRKCRLGSTDLELDECTEMIKNDLTPKVGAGIPEIGLRSLDPFLLNKFTYDQKVGPVTVTAVVRDLRFDGLAQYKTLNFKNDIGNRTMHFEYEAPNILINAVYKAGGSAVLFPITGSGPAVVKVSNMKAVGRMLYKVVIREDGKEIVQLTDCIMDNMSLGGMNVRLRGLFNGNPLFSAVTHYFANNFGSQVFENILKKEMSVRIGDVLVQDILNPTLYNLPYLAPYVKNVKN